MGKIFDKATNSTQYDENIDWVRSDTSFGQLTNKPYWEYLKPYTSKWKGKDLLEIGSGTGWLLYLASEAGVHSAVGLEPSKKNVIAAKKRYPGITILDTSFEDYSADIKFDVIVAVMSFGHIADLNAAFRKIQNLLKPGGELLIIVPDYDYFKKPRYNYKLSFEEINEDEYAVSVERTIGAMADVVRKSSKYEKVGKEVGLELLEDKPMPPTKKLLEQVPKYKEFKGVSLTRLLKFRLTSKA